MSEEQKPADNNVIGYLSLGWGETSVAKDALEVPSIEEKIKRYDAEEKRLVDEKVPCPHCGVPLVTDENHRIRIGRGMFEVGQAFSVNLKDGKISFDGCVSCLTAPALHWESMTERVFELETAKNRADERIVELEDKTKTLESRVTLAVGTLHVRWVTVGIALAVYEIIKTVLVYAVTHS